MASALYAEDLTCSVCLSIFTEPVTLTCGHSFCRGCVAALPEAQCPQCRSVFPSKTDLQLLPTNHILKSLSERAKERPQQRPGPAEESRLCPEHDERMKLFCVTDQQLACIICRDGEAHDGHKFKPIREAAAALRRDIDQRLVNITSQINEIQNLTQAQSGEMKKAKDLSTQLKKQVRCEFEAMHQFLRKREDQILNELRLKEEDAVENMSKSLKAMNQALSGCREQSESWTRILEVTDPELFLRRWSEEPRAKATGDLFRVQSEDLAVVQSPLFQGPYQSHLQFFMWKEMLQVVGPKAELLTLQDNSSYLTVSADKRSFHCASQSQQQVHPAMFGSRRTQSNSGFSFGQFPVYVSVPQSLVVRSTNEFSSGQHYWEVEVQLRDYWCVGITDYYLKYENQTYFACEKDKSTEVSVSDRLLKVGVYLDCSSKTLTFYDADSMVHLIKVFCHELRLPTSAFFSIQPKEPDVYPITICRY